MPERTKIYQIGNTLSDIYEKTDNVVFSGNVNTLGNGLSIPERRWHCLRFINIDIPQGATIVTAKLIFTGYSSSGTPPDVTIYAEGDANPSKRSGSSGNKPSDAPSTTNTVSWTNPTPFQNNVEYDSQDIAVIIQELVNKTGWQNGNAINIITDTGGSVTLGNYNRYYDYSQSENRSVKLEMRYSWSTISGSITQITQPKTKQFFHKVFDKDGVYIGTWGKEVGNTPSFRWNMNGGMGEMTILLKRNIDSFGEGDDVKMGNKVETWIQDGDQEIGRKIWSGVLNRYIPTVDKNGNEIIDIRCVSNVIELEKRMFRDDSDNTTVTKSSKDPSTILREIITSKNAESLFQIGNIDDTGTTVTFTFTGNTYLEAFDVVVSLSPQFWYWRVNADNTVDFRESNFDEVDHALYLGKEVNEINMTKSIEELINRVYFMGGGDPNLYRTYERTSSQSEFGLREKFVKDERVTVVGTAETISTRMLDNFDHPLSQIEITVLDSNIDQKNGYDIERFKPGQIIQILHPRRAYGNTLWDDAIWDVDYWDWSITNAFGVPHQIIEILYDFQSVTLYVSAKLDETTKRIEDISRNLGRTAKVNLPSAPS